MTKNYVRISLKVVFNAVSPVEIWSGGWASVVLQHSRMEIKLNKLHCLSYYFCCLYHNVSVNRFCDLLQLHKLYIEEFYSFSCYFDLVKRKKKSPFFHIDRVSEESYRIYEFKKFLAFPKATACLWFPKSSKYNKQGMLGISEEVRMNS